MILPNPQEPRPGPLGSPAIRTLEAQSLRCLQPFSTQDTRGQPFRTQAQEALDVLLRHPSGGQMPRRWAGGSRRDRPFSPWDPSGLQELKTPPVPLSGTGWWLVANEDQQTAWFPAPYLEEAAPHQGQDGGQPLGISGETDPPPHTPAVMGQCPACARGEAPRDGGGDGGPAVSAWSHWALEGVSGIETPLKPCGDHPASTPRAPVLCCQCL